MKRRLFDIACVASGICLSAIISLWIWGAIVGWQASFVRTGHERYFNVGISKDHLWVTDATWRGSLPSMGDVQISPLGGGTHVEALGVWYDADTAVAAAPDGSTRWMGPHHNVGISFWPLTLATALLPLTWIALRWLPATRRRRRAARGLCLACGYDLTANVSGICPECGRTCTRGMREPC